TDIASASSVTHLTPDREQSLEAYDVAARTPAAAGVRAGATAGRSASYRSWKPPFFVVRAGASLRLCLKHPYGGRITTRFDSTRHGWRDFGPDAVWSGSDTSPRE